MEVTPTADRLVAVLLMVILLLAASGCGAIAPSTPPGSSPTLTPSVSPTPEADRAPAWRATGDLVAPHAFHTSTVLRDGRVLVAGGLINDRLDGKVSSAAELYELSSETWSAAAGMLEGRWGHTATLLLDGKVLVAGSYRNSAASLASAELYDPGTGRWSGTGNMNRGRGGHTATLLPDGTVLVIGGGAEDIQFEGGPRSASAEMYDPRTGQWARTASMIEARTGHTATLLPDGSVLVAGGDSDFRTAESYDPGLDMWTATGSMAEGRFGHTATLLPDGNVLVAGGCACSDPGAGARTSAEVYDPRNGQWTATGTMGTARIFHTATPLADDTVLVVDDGLLDDRPPTAERYDSTSGSWTSTASPAVPRFGYRATRLLDGRVLVTGDYGPNGRSAEVYDPGTPP